MKDLEILFSAIKGAAWFGVAMLALKNIDFIAPIAGVVGSFLYMCGLPTGGLVVRVAVAAYLLIKVIGWC